MSIIIRLDVPALERLIGGDSEIEVQLRQGVVEEFTRRHLTAVIKEDSFAKFLHDEKQVITQGLEALVREEIGEVKNDTWGRINITLRPEIKNALSEEAAKRIGEYVRKTVDEVWAARERRIETEVRQAIAYKTDQLTESLVRDLVRQRLDQISATIKASMNNNKSEPSTE